MIDGLIDGVQSMKQNGNKYTVSATEARVRFGELMRRATQDRQPIYVEKSGKPQVVVLAVEEYERLAAEQVDSSALMRRIEKARALAQADLQGRRLPDAAEVIRQAREERSEQLTGLR